MSSILESLQLNIDLKGVGILNKEMPAATESKTAIETKKETSVTVSAAKTHAYLCHICDKAFPFSIGLDKHKKKKHDLAKIQDQEIIPDANEMSTTMDNDFLLTSDDESLGEETKICDIGDEDQLDSDFESLENHDEPSNSIQISNRRSASKTRRIERDTKLESSPKLYRCDVCPQKMNKRNNINVHMATLHYRNDLKEYYGEKEWTCGVCQREFDTERKLLSHLVIKHRLLNNVLKRKNKSKKKEKVKPGWMYSCPTCTYKSMTYVHMIIHIAAKHHRDDLRKIYGPDENNCSICSKTFAARGNGLTYHLITAHKDLQSFLPSKKTLMSKRGCREEQRMSKPQRSKQKDGKQEATCSKCNKTCSNMSGLRRHWALRHFRDELCNLHLRQNRTKCNFCSKSIDEEAVLLSHLANVHRVLNQFLPTSDIAYI